MKRWLQKQLGLIDARGVPVSKEYSVFLPQAPQHKITDEGVRIVEAFVIDGMKYFQFADPFNITQGRYFATIAAYEELQMRCDREYLELHTNAMENILNQPKIKMTYLVQMNQNLKERLTLMPTADFIYKLASVLFWDETESEHIHDYQYAEKKIARWKKDKTVLDFFLSRPLKTLMPSLNMPTENSPMFLEVAEKLNAIHRQYITAVQSPN